MLAVSDGLNRPAYTAVNVQTAAAVVMNVGR
jgi:hypothetical protein